MKSLLRVVGAVVALVVVAGGGYVVVVALHGPPAAFVDKPVPITSNCKASDVTISSEAGDEVAWTIQQNDVVLVFQTSPFTRGKQIPVAVGPTSTKSGQLTIGAKACAALAGIFGLTCDYSYAITRNNTSCDPKVIVSR